MIGPFPLESTATFRPLTSTKQGVEAKLFFGICRSQRISSFSGRLDRATPVLEASPRKVGQSLAFCEVPAGFSASTCVWPNAAS